MEDRFTFSIPEKLVIAPIAPFLREAKPEIAVLGVESKVWLWNNRYLRSVLGIEDNMLFNVNVIEGTCVKPNCGGKVHFHARNHIGHCFFFDIDQHVPYDYLLQDVGELMFEFELSHVIITQTTKGYHLWSTDIRQHKIAYYELFERCKSLWESDYEFGGQWILRIGPKGVYEPPEVCAYMSNPEKLETLISKAHLTLLRKYANLPIEEYQKILAEQNPIETYARIVCYRSWDVPNRRNEFFEEF